MSNELYDQLIGVNFPCVEYLEDNYKEHYELLKEADEFSAAAVLYPDEKNELLANSLHRYQLILDKASKILKLETDFLLKKKICFNFYTDIANLFGLGTQAYTTETETPYIGVSELSLQNVYLLQLILLHEMQHATDFVYFNGFDMGVAERELRARLTICHSLNELQKQFNKLYKNAYIDQAYWFVILFSSPNISDELKYKYYELLEKPAKDILESDDGVVFSPLILRVFGMELKREGVNLKANTSYSITNRNGLLIMEEKELKIQEEIQEEDTIISDTETYDDKLLSVKLSRMTGEKISDENQPLTLVKNKLIEWHTYKDELKNMKKNANIIITRNAESLSNISTVENTNLSVPKIIKVEKQFIKMENDFEKLRNINIPNSTYKPEDFSNDDSPIIILNNANRKKVIEEDNEAQNFVNNLSDFFKGKK
ncbi:MAG: hypothetical protein KatS3mg068_0026 [Candidatus Sericytochromatia bacterium]|nr:MAG: hypothetical protein KatS3mg068_0026 [Candidatus Sericytochromatia bacterium]